MQSSIIKVRQLLPYTWFIFVDDVVKHNINPIPVYRVKRLYYVDNYGTAGKCGENGILRVIIQDPYFEEAEIHGEGLDLDVRVINIG